MLDEYAKGYKIVQSVCFDDGGGVALGIDSKAAFPLTTWQFTEKDDKKMFYCGYYFSLYEAEYAKLDYDNRVKEYKAGNPGVTEKYNYLASVEISDEGNYNMIDGIINNTPKPSLLERMKEYELRIAENRNNEGERKLNRPAIEEL